MIVHLRKINLKNSILGSSIIFHLKNFQDVITKLFMKMIDCFVHVNKIRKPTIESLESIIKSDRSGVEVNVSYNGKDFNERLYLKSFCDFNNLSFSFNDTKTALDHISLNISKSRHQFVIFLHDDDMVSVNFFQHYKALIKKYSGSYSICCNDTVRIGDRYKINRLVARDQFLVNKSEILLSYLLNRHFLAFPAICYRKDVLKKINLCENIFGKYIDVYIVLNLIESGLIFSGEKNFTYRIHDDQDSKDENKSDKKRLRLFLFIELLKSVLKRELYFSFVRVIKKVF